jgi:hypothetical protein
MSWLQAVFVFLRAWFLRHSPEQQRRKHQWDGAHRQ